MADRTKIEWTDASWVMIAGCDHVSEGCGLPRWDGDLPGGCYAAKLTSGRLKRRPEYESLAERGRFNGKVRLLEHRLEQPLYWRKPRKIFVSDMADLFHKEVPDEFIARVFGVMAVCPQHAFQCLTKRHARMRSLLTEPEFWQRVGRHARHIGYGRNRDRTANFFADGRNIYDTAVWEQIRFLPNVWLGVSVESQKWADIRIPALMDTPAAVRWISAEPLLGPLDLSLWTNAWNRAIAHSHSYPEHVLGPYDDAQGDAQIDCVSCDFTTEHGGLDWVVTGGESGPGARPAHPDWFRTIRDQCQAAGVAYFHKQHGAYTWQIDGPYREPNLYVNAETGAALPPHEVPEAGSWQGVWKVGKKAAGRVLDGREWLEYPQQQSAEVIR